MWLATLLALTFGATVERGEAPTDRTSLEASLTFLTEVGPGGPALGGKLHLGLLPLAARGAVSGPYLSFGADGTYAQSALAGCVPDLCASRGSVGLTIRLGWAWWTEASRWPDHSLYLQLAGGVAWESVPDAPLAPSASRAAPFTRLSAGCSSLWFTRAFAARIVERASDWRFWLIALLPLAVLDHLEVGLGWSGATLTPAGLRFSVSTGFGF